jgi:hypothetical protein
MGIHEFERIFNEHAYPTLLYEQKSEKEVIKQFVKIDLNIEYLNKISRPFEHIEVFSDMVRRMIMYIISKPNEGKLLTLEDLRRIREILQSDYLPLQEKYLEGLEQALKVDVERKKEIYAKNYGIEWNETLDPRKELMKLSENLPRLERLKIYLEAEACAEFGREKFLLWKEFFDEGKISYNVYRERPMVGTPMSRA